MSKAQEKRNKQLKQALTSHLNRVLIDFKNKYFDEYCKWNVNVIQYKLDQMPQQKPDDLLKMYEGKDIENTYFVRYLTPNQRRNSRSYNIDKYMIQQMCGTRRLLQNSIKRSALLHHKFYSEAQQGYQKKFDNLVDKLVHYQFSIRFLKVQQIDVNHGQLEFLISDNVKECHARAIWVEGNIKAPHYRFITTIRKRK